MAGGMAGGIGDGGNADDAGPTIDEVTNVAEPREGGQMI